MKTLLELRNKSKKRKPSFKRSDSNRLPFKNKWRKPRGLHNKRRLQKAGHQKNPSKGYRSPVLVRGLHKEGLRIINISCFKELENVNPKEEIVEISSNVGMKSKIKIVNECKLKNIKITNVKDIDKFIKEFQEKLEAKKKIKNIKEQKKKKSKEESIKKAEEKKAKETEEDKQEKIKEDVMAAKPKEIEKQKVAEPQKINNQKSKAGHDASSVPGKKQ